MILGFRGRYGDPLINCGPDCIGQIKSKQSFAWSFRCIGGFQTILVLFMFILGGIILEISNHRYSSCYHLQANVEITGQASILHGVFSLVYLLIVLFTLDVFTLFRGLDGKWDILRAGYIVFFSYAKLTSRYRFFKIVLVLPMDVFLQGCSIPSFPFPSLSYSHSYHISYK